VPDGVFNLVNGDGPGIGAALAAHPGIDIVSFTGSTRAGVEVARSAAASVKRVAQELGGKSANIILRGADITCSVEKGVAACWLNSGQSCNAPTRMLVPSEQHEEAVAVARAVAARTRVGRPSDPSATIGPVVNERQYQRIQQLIQTGMDEGAQLVAGGVGKPDGLDEGFYVKPTIFAGVTRDMEIARQEVFGPVLAIMPYDDEQEAIDIANDSIYGLAAYVQARDVEHARRVAKQMRTGQVFINYPANDLTAPFGGYKQSGNGREYAEYGIAEYLELKAIIGHG
jgi:aldehyde dehydrogenase (NAD+)